MLRLLHGLAWATVLVQSSMVAVVQGREGTRCICLSPHRRALATTAEEELHLEGAERTLLQRGPFDDRREPCYCDSGPRPPPPPTPAQYEAQRKREAESRQKKAAAAAANTLAVQTEGVLFTPGPRGKLGHTRRCDVATDDKVLTLLVDQSERLWRKAKPLFEAAARLVRDKTDYQGVQLVQDVVAQCLAIGDRVQRIALVNNLGGEKVEDLFKETCDLEGHLDGVIESALVESVKLVFDTPAGEYLSLLLNKVVKGGWPSSVDYCSLVCRKNHSGTELNKCVIGCAEINLPGCWSQCRVYTCNRACKNAFWHRKKKRRSCYRKCESKCSYD